MKLPLWITLFAVFFPDILLFAQAPATPARKVDPAAVEIVRDTWGVPHIYATTDAEVMYGLAWAQAEDDFRSVQDMLLVCRGRFAESAGKGGAGLDFLYHLVNIPEVVRQRFERDISPQFRPVIDAYCQGLNDYVKAHPEDVKYGKLFPITPQDVVAGYAFTGMLLTNFPYAVAHAWAGKTDDYTVGFSTLGSNAFAISPDRTHDGSTYLAVNSHQPLEGIFSWYEAHLHSGEGLNMIGGVFPGGMGIFHGTKPMHGWAATLNYADLTDTYRLTVKRGKYRYDGQWLPLQTRKIHLKVKVGPVRIPVARRVYQSVHGPVIHNKRGEWIAFRTPVYGRVGGAEQVYRMNKARNLEEFRDAFRMGQLPSVNFVFADHTGNIFYLHNSQFPLRKPGYDWLHSLPGDTSAVVWSHSLSGPDSMPQVLNPSSGYLVSVNQSPYHATVGPDRICPENYPAEFGLQTEHNNRSIRAMELLEEMPRLDWNDFKRLKYDHSYPTPQRSPFIASLMHWVNEQDLELYPKRLHPLMKQMMGCSLLADSTNTRIGPVLMTLLHIFKKKGANSMWLERELPIERHEWEHSLQYTRRNLKRHFGRYDVPLGQLQQLVRGTKRYPMLGAPDVIAAMNSVVDEKTGKLKPIAGESYIQMVRFGRNGVEYLGTVNAFGSSNRPESPHYTDQMEMFIHQKLKPMSFDRDTILRDAEAQYHPGEAWSPRDWRTEPAAPAPAESNPVR